MKVQKKDQEYFESREKKAKIIIKELKEEGFSPKKKYAVLEVGCNHGFITYHLSQHTNWNLKGGDITSNVETYKKKFKKYISINHLDATNIDFKNNTFDIVIFNHVMEHIPRWEKAIKEIYRVLKKGGAIYLATPNKYRKIPNKQDKLKVTLKVLFKNKSTISRKERIHFHIGFSAKEIIKLLKPFNKITCLNKEHFITNSPKILKPILKILPKSIHEKRAQTCLFIAIK